MGTTSRGQHKPGKPKATRVRRRAPMQPQAPLAGAVGDAATGLPLPLQRGEAAQAPVDARLLDEPVSFLEADAGESAQAEGLPEFLEPTEACEPPEPPHCP
jgi:hypothetical protein